MQPYLDQISQVLSGYVPNLLVALAILVVGWLVALVLAALVRAGLRRTTLDDRIAAWILGEERAKQISVEKWAARGVYYVALVFVLIAFLQRLNLTITAEPLAQLLNQLSSFIPRLIGGGVLLLIAWVLATVLRQVILRLLKAARFDERLGGQVGIEDLERPPVSETLSNAAYWLIFLLFLPAILGALALEGLLGPVQNMTDQVLGFLPNLLAAGLILAVGWFLARIVQRTVANLLAAAGADRLSEKVGLDTAFGKTGLSGLVGLIVYVLILIPVVITSLNTLQLDAIAGPATAMLGTIMDVIPSIFAAVLLLALGYLVGRFLAGLVTNLLTGAGFNTLLAKLGLMKEQEGTGTTPSTIAGYLTLIAVMLFAATEASRLLGFDALAGLVSRFTVFLGQVLLGLIVFGIGLYLANIAAQAIRASDAGQAGLLALAARVSILVLSGAMALSQMGLAADIISLAFGILLGAVAVAAALAFGLGGRDIAAKKIQSWMESMDK